MTPMKRHLAALLIIPLAVLCQPAWAATNPSDRDAQILEDARAAIRKGDVKTALIQLKKAVKDNPSNGEARFELGVLEFRMRDYVAAEKELLQARANNYDVAKVNPVLATTLLAQGKFQQLLDTVQPCPDSVECKGNVMALRARARMGLKDLNGAGADSQAAIEAQPDGIASRLARALYLRANGDQAGATALVDALLATNPKLPDVLTLKAELMRQANDLPGATNTFRQALEINPKDLNARLQLAMTLMASNQDAEASTEIEQVLRAAPKAPMAIYVKAVLLTRAHKTAEAGELVRPLESTIASIPRGTFLLAMIHAANNDLEQALDYANRFHTAQPDNLVGAKLLANIQFRQRSFDKVIATLSPLRDQLADDADALNMLGSAYLAEGQVKDANELLTEAVKARPDDPLTRARLAVSQATQSATHDVGIRELESLVKANPDNERIDLALFSSYIASGDYDHAIKAAETMAKSQPKSPLPLVMWGSAQLAQGKDQEAREKFTSALKLSPNFVPAAVYLSELDMRGNQFDQARTLLDGLLKQNAGDVRLLIARSQVEIRNGKHDAALPFLEAAVKAHPEDAEPQIQLMKVQIATGHNEQAILNAQDLAQKNRRNPAIVDMAARVLLMLGRKNEGISLYQRLEADFPESAQLHQRTGQILMALGDLPGARTAFDRAIAADVRFIPAWVDRASLELKMTGLDAAEVIADKAKRENPTNESVALLPADIMAQAGKTAEAEKIYHEQMAKAPSAALAARLFKMAQKRGDHAQVEKVAGGWLKDHPDDLTIRAALAEDEFARNNVKEAVAQYEILNSKQPRNAGVLNNLAMAYDRAKDPRALDAAKRAYQLAPGVADIVDTYAMILYRSGDTKHGAEMQRQAYAASPKNPSIAFHMAQVLADSKDATTAKAILQPIVDGKQPFDEYDQAKALLTQLSGS